MNKNKGYKMHDLLSSSTAVDIIGEGLFSHCSTDIVETTADPVEMIHDARKGIFVTLMASIRTNVGEAHYTSWFTRLLLEKGESHTVRMSVPTAFLKRWIVSNYSDLLLELWKQHEPTVLKVEVTIRGSTRQGVTPPVDPETIQKPRRSGFYEVPQSPVRMVRHQPKPAVAEIEKQVGATLDERYTFENLVEGVSNQDAVFAARAIADETADSYLSTLFVHGGVGVGKTHLLHAIANRYRANDSTSRIVYLTAEYFTWRYSQAVREGAALPLREQMRDIDLLIIDDVHFLQSKTVQQPEFKAFLHDLIDGAGQVVIASTIAPTELSIDPGTRSRLTAGTTIMVGSPDFTMRRAMLQLRLDAMKATDASADIPSEILDHIARAVDGSGRDLEGAFNQISFRRSIEPDLSIDRIDDILGHVYRSGEPKRIRIEEIQRIVAKHYNVSKAELLSSRRTRNIVKPRQVAMYLAKVMTPRSLPEIGRRFGGRDHTTVLHAVRKIEGMSGTDAAIAQEMDLLRRLIADQAC